MDRFEVLFVKANRALVALTLLAFFLIVFVNVIGRYGFGASLSWGEEAARHLMIFGAFCGAGLALREGRLVAIEVVPDLVPDWARVALRWFAVLAMGVFMAVLLWLGWQFTEFGMRNMTMSTGVPRAIPFASIPIGCAFFLIHLAFFARRYVRAEFEIDDSADEAIEIELDSGARS